MLLGQPDAQGESWDQVGRYDGGIWLPADRLGYFGYIFWLLWIDLRGVVGYVWSQLQCSTELKRSVPRV